jgi:hypothetical protein
MSKQQEKEKLWTISLNRRQLEHLRDLMTIVLPHDYSRRISLELALTEKRLDAEASLWVQICDICETADIPIGSDAPDFTVTTTSIPRIEVSRVMLSSNSIIEQNDDESEEDEDEIDE